MEPENFCPAFAPSTRFDAPQLAKKSRVVEPVCMILAQNACVSGQESRRTEATGRFASSPFSAAPGVSGVRLSDQNTINLRTSMALRVGTLLAVAGLLGASLSAQVTRVTTLAALGSNDTITWNQLGSDSTSIINGISATSLERFTITGPFATTTRQIVDVGSCWSPASGAFANGTFLHASALLAAGRQSVSEGQRVEFNAVRSNNGKGDQAENLRLA
jgi:cold shock CspA family protein